MGEAVPEILTLYDITLVIVYLYMAFSYITVIIMNWLGFCEHIW